MGRFYECNGKYGPSESYLETHQLPDFDPENDWYNDEYDVEEDDEVYLGLQNCAKCGASYTIADLLSSFREILERNYHIDPGSYDEFDESLCPDCAAEDWMEKHS